MSGNGRCRQARDSIEHDRALSGSQLYTLLHIYVPQSKDEAKMATSKSCLCTSLANQLCRQAFAEECEFRRDHQHQPVSDDEKRIALASLSAPYTQVIANAS
jgi:hypothetical protein